MDPKEYEEKVIKKLVDEFQQNFYDKVGFRPVVIINREEEKVVQKVLSLDDLKEIVDSHLPEKFKTNGWTLESGYRYREVVMLRQIFCYIAKKQGYNLKPIGEKLGNRDHTTVIHSVRTASNLLATDPIFISVYDNIIYDLVKNHGDEFALLHSVKEKWDNSQSALHPVLL
jgi:chromosomal replication initiation ATPase DnaA